jgi:sec-independent protein translocase protein TatA
MDGLRYGIDAVPVPFQRAPTAACGRCQLGSRAMTLAFVLSPFHMLVFLVIVLLLFGNRLPDTMRSLGKSVTEFKKGVKEGNEEDEPKRVEHE